MSVNWSQYSSAPSSFNQPGDVQEGELVRVTSSKFTDADGTAKPILHLRGRDGAVNEVGCSPANLRRLLMQENPGLGDWVHIQYIGEEPKDPNDRSGKNPAKLFQLVVTRANGRQPQQAPQPQPAYQGPPPQQQAYPPQQSYQAPPQQSWPPPQQPQQAPPPPQAPSPWDNGDDSPF